MPFTGRICTRGVWDETVPQIQFDVQGVSNYAHLSDRLAEAFPRGEKGRTDWDDIVKKIKLHGRTNKYDCIIGVSGGTDSSFLLHIAKEQGLRPLAVNLDNGWNSDIAVKNIKKMTEILGIDLETYVVNYEEIKDLIKSYMYAGLPWIDMPTDLAIKGVLYKIANREGIRYILRGNDFRSEGSQPTEWTYGDGRQLRAVHRKFGNVRLNTYPKYTLINLLYYGFIRRIKSIYPYYYLDYNKKRAQEFLIEKYKWEYYGGHHYENVFTKFVMSYWLPVKYGIDKRKITLSAQVLSGEINRKDAIAIIEKTPYDISTINIQLDFVIKKLDLTKEKFERIMQLPNSTYEDYPSYSLIFNRWNRYAIPLLKLIFVHKPQSLFQAEMRNKRS
jgi:N-acetyl sugar amidotransferase